MKVLAAILLFANIVFSQVENSTGLGPYNEVPVFFFDIANYKSNTNGLAKTDIFIQLPYSNIQFVKSGNIYTGKYSVTLSFLDEEQDKVLTEKIWNENITVSDFSQTTSQSNFNLSYKTFLLAPGNYQNKMFC